MREVELLCAVLQGEQESWPEDVECAFEQNFLDMCISHGAQHILFQKLTCTEPWECWPRVIRDALISGAKNAAAFDSIRQREIMYVLDALAHSNIRPLLLKGAALAHTHYEKPFLRYRFDTDFLIQRGEFKIVAHTLIKLGYAGPIDINVNFASYQCVFEKTDSSGIAHEIDVHWKLNNAQSFANVFTYEELERGSVELPQLGHHARTLGLIHTMLLACMHKAAHVNAPLYINGETRSAENRLIWVYDIHLLAVSMSALDWNQFVTLAKLKRLCKVCVDGLSAAQESFGTAFRQW